ncbi:MAG: hypothetical protein GY791_21590 [Alphaproteobacteria bacterium]|nr:hypothetical protein [Alphaproteobacteria bacterium]
MKYTTLVFMALACCVIVTAPAPADSVRGGCYAESDHFRCIDRPYREDRSIRTPVVPPRPSFSPAEQRTLDMTGKPRFTGHTDSLRPELRPQGAVSAAEGRARRYRPIPDQDAGRYMPGTRISPSSPLFGRAGSAGAFGLRSGSVLRRN